jgi:hypothetical protein
MRGPRPTLSLEQVGSCGALLLLVNGGVEATGGRACLRRMMLRAHCIDRPPPRNEPPQRGGPSRDGTAVLLAPTAAGLLASCLLAPVFAARPRGALVECREAPSDVLLAMLAARELDVVLTDDEPAVERISANITEVVRNVEYGFFAAGEPRSGSTPQALDGVPMLMPAAGTGLRSRLSRLFEKNGVSPDVVGECEDGALLIELARDGRGAICAPEELRTVLGTVHGLRAWGLPRVCMPRLCCTRRERAGTIRSFARCCKRHRASRLLRFRRGEDTLQFLSWSREPIRRMDEA